jgi:hypothetical protein
MGMSVRAEAEAFTKADIKPSFTLCFSKNASLNSFLISINFDISHYKIKFDDQNPKIRKID